MAEQQGQEQLVEHETAVATAVPHPQGADADQTAHAVARHRRDQGACCEVSKLTSRNGLRPVPNALTTASQPFKRNGLSP
jgi:hypothetical protein